MKEASATSSEKAVQVWKRFPPRDLVCGNRVSALHDGAEGFPALHEAIEAAEFEILFEMYWFESDRAGWGIANRLIDAAKRGVTVRVVYDGFGCMDADKKMFEKMRENGCEVLEFNPIPPWQRKFRVDRIFRRDHRKMMVVDRKVAFTGGMNICDFWLPKDQGGDAWRDVIVRIEGPVAPAFAGIFERLVGPLRDGDDDRGDDSAEEEKPACPRSIRPTFLRALLGWRSADNGNFQELRDELALSVDKGRDAMTRSLLKRLNALPDDTLMLFPVGVRQENTVKTASDAWWSAQGRLRMGLAQVPQDAAAAEAAAADAAAAEAAGAGAAASAVAGAPSATLGMGAPRSSSQVASATHSSDAEAEATEGGRSVRKNAYRLMGARAYAGLRPRDLFFEQVQTRWQKLGSNVQIITNDALSERNTIRRGYLRALQNAKRQITIVNSYFLPCSSIRRELYRAADRGVDVRIVVPGEKTDLQSVRLATHAMYERMLSKGIQLYEYMPSVLHSKVCIIDGEVCTVGTYNLDYRSWYYNLEIVTVIHDAGFASDLLSRIQHDIDHACVKVEHSTWLTRSWVKRLAESFFYTFRHHM